MTGSNREAPGEKNGLKVKTPRDQGGYEGAHRGGNAVENPVENAVENPVPTPDLVAPDLVAPDLAAPDLAAWQALRSGLRQVHTAVAYGLRDDREAEPEALRALAAAPAFDPFGPLCARDGCTEEERGRWLADRVVRGVERARDTVPEVVPGGLRGSAEQALVLWCLHVALGIPLDELGAAQQGDIEPPLHGRDLAQKIEGRMWLSARPTSRSRPGIDTLYHEVQAALRDRFPTREDDTDGELARAHFGYEWHRLTRLGQDAERELLTLLSTLAPAPLPVSFLAEAWGPLPDPLRDLGNSTALMALALRRLLDRGLLLVTARGDTRLVAIPRLLHPLPTETLDAPQRRRRANIALRFLGVALRGDTHDHDAWPEWRDALPHVLHVVNLADQHGDGLPEAADLMDRLSVFHRVRGDDTAALTAADRALHLYERAHTPVPATYATYLTNHAMAVRAVEGAEAALKSIERALAIEVEEGGGVERVDQVGPANRADQANVPDGPGMLGAPDAPDAPDTADASDASDTADQVNRADLSKQVNRAGPAKQVNRLDADHAQTLNLYASILESAGRSQQADEAFRQALTIARHSHQDSGDEEDAETLVMVLNDYSVHLLHHAPEQGASAKSQAAEVLRLLEEAETAGRTGGYGTEQIMLNRAEALRRLDRPEDATRVLEDLIALCEQWDEPTLLLFAALANLAEILAALGDPRHGEVLRRAHEIDDLLATS
ncbi:hypothetical protein JHN63_29305 [Streptomyces sp. MBT65]|uniref:hypothetical protein n=1 Tax=Streptomyces sp. MBT65 TaxID=1488395 RepID=UPI00190B6699|nr:hypothetical protein [Streptomyces sp. MBT65]MBK3577825.1 hypothetical protein [Streptomyces sp. MBT65]